MIGIINKPLLLHLVGCLYYLELLHIWHRSFLSTCRRIAKRDCQRNHDFLCFGYRLFIFHYLLLRPAWLCSRSYTRLYLVNGEILFTNVRGFPYKVYYLCPTLPQTGLCQYILTFQSLLVAWCTTSLTFNNCTICPHCIYVFCIYLRKNSDLCHIQPKLISFHNPDEKCLQLGTDWVFKYSGLRFGFKWLRRRYSRAQHRHVQYVTC